MEKRKEFLMRQRCSKEMGSDPVLLRQCLFMKVAEESRKKECQSRDSILYRIG